MRLALIKGRAEIARVIGVTGVMAMIVSALFTFNNATLAQYLEPTNRTNINKIDPLFERTIEDYQGFRKDLEGEMKLMKSNMKFKGGAEQKEKLKNIPHSDKAQEEARKLSNIREEDLSSRGRAEMSKDPFYNDMFVDSSKPGLKQHSLDAENIAKASGNLMNNLLRNLKDIGVDCKTVKGNKEIDPEYFIEINRKEDERSSVNKGDTVYDQYFCERARRQYSCKDALNLTCKTKGLVGGVWRDRSMNYYDVPSHWLRIIAPAHHGLGDVSLWHMKIDTQIMHEVRVVIANKINANLDQIDPWIDISERGAGKLHTWEVGTFDGGSRSNSGRQYYSAAGKWEYHVFRYKYRELIPTCLEWQENWEEICVLQ